jgi:SAM-dependent methyltransferase
VAEQYGTLAEVYDFLVPEELLTPDGNAAAFDGLYQLEPGARVLDCAAGTGTFAVGMALRGYDVTATDASEAMIARTRELAARHATDVDARVCAWEQLTGPASFDAVFCIGNSIPHAEGQAGRRRALAAMASVLRPGGLFVITSRNWEMQRDYGSHLAVSEQLVERDGVRALVARAWTIPEDWDAPHAMDVVVALIGDDGSVTPHGERLRCWAYRHETLDEDLRAAGLEPENSTYEPEAGRYLVTARRRGSRSRA